MIDLMDDLLCAITATPIKCCLCGEEYLEAEVYEHAFEGFFRDGKKFPLCAQCFGSPVQEIWNALDAKETGDGADLV